MFSVMASLARKRPLKASMPGDRSVAARDQSPVLGPTVHPLIIHRTQLTHQPPSFIFPHLHDIWIEEPPANLPRPFLRQQETR
jgi:hypothetical protein